MTKDKNRMTVYELLCLAESIHHNKEAIYDLTQRVSYRQLKKDVDQLAASFIEQGFKKGDRIAVALPNWYETTVIFFAVAKIGAILVPFNPSYKAHEVQYILHHAEPKALFVTEKFDGRILEEDQPLIITVRFEQQGTTSYADLLNERLSEADEAVLDVDEDVYCLLYTSGTTGTPKGVMITHRGVIQSANTLAKELRCTEQDVFLIAAPLFHIFGMACNLFTGLTVGARMVIKEKYHPREMLVLIEQERVTIQQGVPTMFLKELEVEDFDHFDLSTLRAGMVGASPIPPNKVKEVRDRLGMNLCQSFGITETCTVTMTPYDDDEQKIIRSLGKAIPGVRLKIVDENRSELPAGQTGEIAIHSFGTMKGYYKMPEETARVVDAEGWFYTGDLGILDDEGYLYFVGRAKEMIIRGGYNIYPQEIEAVLTKHPAVSNSAVIGLPDDVLGEVVCAVIQLKNGQSTSEEELKNYLKEQIATYKVPGKIIFTEEFPSTASGKIQKVKLREELMSTINSPVSH
ncbi:acyl--CoA ligase [Sporosarcina sp. ACRSM]|uniref:class I adenylate-forming enzyme family protein n=1 Tax=Sporosarcina sp. ACRSM TaxID=2918216 RepID=UPI001EF63715|nr:class I adenylate-forming enzyme family protein [Sporosarcina sp. ACRSM]MCG7336272.1 acyl--CoA ligase [Sporosarcina sp. ACRSM]